MAILVTIVIRDSSKNRLGVCQHLAALASQDSMALACVDVSREAATVR